MKDDENEWLDGQEHMRIWYETYDEFVLRMMKGKHYQFCEEYLSPFLFNGLFNVTSLAQSTIIELCWDMLQHRKQGSINNSSPVLKGPRGDTLKQEKNHVDSHFSKASDSHHPMRADGDGQTAETHTRYMSFQRYTGAPCPDFSIVLAPLQSWRTQGSRLTS